MRAYSQAVPAPVRRSALFLLATAAAATALLGQPQEPGQRKAPPRAAAAHPPQEFTQLFAAAPAHEPQGAVEISLTLKPGDRIADLLERTRVAVDDAASAEKLIAAAVPSRLPDGSDLSIALGPKDAKGRHRLELLSVRNIVGQAFVIRRGADGQLTMGDAELGPDLAADRFSGTLGETPYWALRSAGVPGDAALEYLEAIGTAQPKLRPSDKFDLIIANPRRGNGAKSEPRPLYAALLRTGEPPMRRVKWVVDGQARWVDPSRPLDAGPAFTTPVGGRITSHFGGRAHPILRLFRFHRGIDIAAPAGTPIVAAADGRVIGAGWNGGHGRQVRLLHPDGSETSYSHMSAIAAHQGTEVRQGQVIGYVGSTGLSTGPHLHYELHRDGRPVDPMLAAMRRDDVPRPGERKAMVRQLQRLLAVATVKSGRSG